MAMPGGYLSANANPDLTGNELYHQYWFGIRSLQSTVWHKVMLNILPVIPGNLLQDVPISTTTGFSSALANVGEINNKGIEVEIGGDIINNQLLRWGASRECFIHSIKSYQIVWWQRYYLE